MHEQYLYLHGDPVDSLPPPDFIPVEFSLCCSDGPFSNVLIKFKRAFWFVKESDLRLFELHDW